LSFLSLFNQKNKEELISYEEDDQLNFESTIRICPKSDFPLKLSLVSKEENTSLKFSDVKTPHRKYLWHIDDSQKNLATIE
jgi:hypothetical protein